MQLAFTVSKCTLSHKLRKYEFLACLLIYVSTPFLCNISLRLCASMFVNIRFYNFSMQYFFAFLCSCVCSFAFLYVPLHLWAFLCVPWNMWWLSICVLLHLCLLLCICVHFVARNPFCLVLFLLLWRRRKFLCFDWNAFFIRKNTGHFWAALIQNSFRRKRPADSVMESKVSRVATKTNLNFKI